VSDPHDEGPFSDFETPAYDAVETTLGVPLDEAESLLAKLREVDPKLFKVLASVIKDLWDLVEDALS
jgi:hypothetical protein